MTSSPGPAATDAGRENATLVRGMSTCSGRLADRCSQRPEILVARRGYVGLYTALRLQSEAAPRRGESHVVDPRSYMTYQPFLPEAAAGSLEPRHVVVPLRRVLRGCRGRHRARSRGRPRPEASPDQPSEGPDGRDRVRPLVVALGSVARTLPIPGLAEHGIGFKQVEEAISLRNHVLDRLDVAHPPTDPSAARRALTFVVRRRRLRRHRGAGRARGHGPVRERFYPDSEPSDLRWVLVEATGRILPEVGEDMGRYTVEQLRKRGIDVRLETRLESCVDGHVVLSDGEEFDAETLVWTAGVKPNPVLATDLPRDERGRIAAAPTLQVEGHRRRLDRRATARRCRT